MSHYITVSSTRATNAKPAAMSDPSNSTAPSTHFIATSVTFKAASFDKIISNELFGYFDTIVNFWCILLLSSAGVVTNILCAVVFLSQGFKEGVNVSMLSVTFWNELKCLSGLLNRMYGPISLFSADASSIWRIWTSFNQYTPIFAGYVAYCLVAYISIERLLCVSRPFTVKNLLTPKRTFSIVTTISVFTYGFYFIMHFVYELANTLNPYSNKSILAVQYNQFYRDNEMIIMPYYKSSAILIPSLSFVVLCVCSVCTVLQIQKSSRSLYKEKPSLQLSQREKKVTKVLLAVIVVNICNLFPRIVFYIGQLVEPEFYVIRKYHNLFMTAAMYIYILDYVNAVVNLFIFLRMSLSFRETFYSVLCKS
ncbi:peptide receptor GPCR [Biomphalaria glabrata]|nr:putative G-protein coupled receptor frpr-1 [Biomphalaria glabrata]